MTKNKLKLLIIEDNPGDALLIESYLTDAFFYQYESIIAESLTKGLSKLKDEPFDIVTLDLGLPDAVGLEGVEKIRDEYPGLCLIVVTGNDNKALGFKAINLGAQDYLNKNHLDTDSIDKALAFAFDRLKAQQQLAMQQDAYETAMAQYHLLAENTMDIIMVVDKNLKVDYISPKIKEISGFTAEEFVKLSWKQIVYPEDLLKVEGHIKALRGGQNNLLTEFRIVRKLKKGPIWVEVKVERKEGFNSEKDLFVVRIRDIQKRKMAEEFLRRSETRLRTALEGTQAGYWEWNLETNALNLDKKWADLLGYELDEIYPKTFDVRLKLVYTEDLEIVEKALDDCINGETGLYDVKFRMNHKQGHQVWIWARGMVVDWDNKGKPNKISGTHQDISDQIENELKVKESELEYRYLAESFPHVLWKADKDGHITYINENGLKKFGLAFNQLAKNGWISIIHPDDHKQVKGKWNDAIHAGKDYTNEQRMKIAEGSYHWFRVEAIFHKQKDQADEWIGTSTDINEERLVQQALSQNEADLQRGFSIAKLGRWEYNITTNRFTFFQDSMAVLKLSSGEEIVTQEDMEDHIHPEDLAKAQETVRKIYDTGRFILEHRFIHNDKSVSWFRIIGDLVQFGKGNQSLVKGVIQDITEEKKLYEEVHASNERYKNTLANITEGYVIFEESGKVTELNNAGIELLKISDDQTVVNMQDYWVDEKKQGQIIDQLRDKRKLLRQDIEIRDAKGNNSLYRFNFQKNKFTNAKEIYEASFHDISKDYYEHQLSAITSELFKYKEDNSLNDLIQFGVDSCQVLSKSKIAFFHLVNDDQDTIKLTQWSNSTKKYCEVPELITHYPIREAGIWVDCIKKKRPVVHNDYQAIHKKGALPEGHVFLHRDLEIPIIDNNKVVGIIGVGNKPYDYTQLDADILKAFGEAFWSMINYKKAQEKVLEQAVHIKESQKQYSALVDNVKGVVYQSRIEGNHFHALFVSNGCFELTGYTPEEFINKPELIIEIVHPSDREEVLNSNKQAMKEPGEYEQSFRIVDKEKNIKWITDRYRSYFDSKEGGMVMQGILSDITERVRSQENILNEVMNAELRERSRISKELHDGLQQTLSSTFHNFESIKKPIGTLSQTVQAKYLRGKKLLQRSIEESREIAHRLLPKVIEENGLYIAMESLVNSLESTELCFNYHHNLNEHTNLNKQMELTIFRVAQEGLSNILKYAKAKNINMQLILYSDEIMLTLEDDGDGFDQKMTKVGFGIISMKNRAEALGGYLQIDSRIGKGTNLLLSIPLKTELDFSYK